MVPKANTTEQHLVIDYKVLNKMLTPDRYSLPHLLTVYKLLHGSSIFSTVDLKSTFHRAPIAPEDNHNEDSSWSLCFYENPF